MSDDNDNNEDKLSSATRDILANLTPREAKALRDRFENNLSQDPLLEEVGRHFDVTEKRIKEIEERALKKLRVKKKERKLEVSCSFCRKYKSEVKKMIQADTGVTICDECLKLCNEIINDQDER